jgi:hypothetical protein
MIICGVELTGSDAVVCFADSELEVRLLPPALIKSTLAANPLPIAFAETGLKAFQETAFTAAYVAHSIPSATFRPSC